MLMFCVYLLRLVHLLLLGISLRITFEKSYCFSIGLSWPNVDLYFWPCFFGPLFVFLHSFLLQTFKHESVSSLCLGKMSKTGREAKVLCVGSHYFSFFWEEGQVTFTLSIPTFPWEALNEICPVKMWWVISARCCAALGYKIVKSLVWFQKWGTEELE